MYDKSNFFAVLPAAVRYNPRLSARAVLLYAVLTSLAASDGEAYAANAYLADALGTSERTINRLLAELTCEKYITIRFEYKDGTREIARRLVRIRELPTLLDMPNTQALYAVIPSHILAMYELSVQAKLLYAEISAATPTDGYCSKPAMSFAQILCMSTSTVRRLIKELVDVDALRVEMEYKGESKEIACRRIYLTAAADIVEKRRQIAAGAEKSLSSDKQSNDADVSNSCQCGRFRGVLNFVNTPEKGKSQSRKVRKIRRKRKKAGEYMRL